MMRLAGKIAFAALLGLTLAACSDTAGSNDADDAVGAYTLRTIDGQNLPVIVDQQGNDIAEVIQGSVTLNANRTFTDLTVLRITEGGVVTTENDETSGTWSLAGRTVQFAPGGLPAPYAMAWDGGDELTQLFNGFTLVYRR